MERECCDPVKWLDATSDYLCEQYLVKVKYVISCKSLNDMLNILLLIFITMLEKVCLSGGQFDCFFLCVEFEFSVSAELSWNGGASLACDVFLQNYRFH